MKTDKRRVIASVLCGVFLCCTALWSSTTGKIAGTVTDKESGDPLPGANVVVVGTDYGAAADLEGRFTILNLPPGFYSIQFSVIGYARVTVTNVRVMIDQTTPLDMDMEMEAVLGEAVTVVAEKNIVKRDVATSVVAVTGAELEELPVSSIQQVVGLQAGIQSGLQIRGGGAQEALVLLDGVTLRDPRNNNPISSLALSAVQEISIERGGFNAEYGHVRSGIVNVVTKEGSATHYHGSIDMRYSKPGPKHFGISPFDPNSFWLRPYYDDAVCWEGTHNGAWDTYTRNQYPDFVGWNAISERLMTDSDPTNDLSPLGAQRVFMWETRKQPPLDQPDYDIDAGFGGPVPFIGTKLGNLRFFTSYRRHREMLLVPLTRDDYIDYDWNMKLISDISPSMKLMVSGLMGKQYTMQANWSYSYLRYPGQIAGTLSNELSPLFGTGMFSLSDIGHKNIAAKLTHTLNPRTFYEVSLEHIYRTYYTRPPARRDTREIHEVVPGYFVDEAPFGYDVFSGASEVSGMIFGQFTCKRRDNSKVSATTLKANLTSQLNFNNLVKAGVELVYNDLNLDYGEIDNYQESKWKDHIRMHVFPIRAAFYIQDKLETKYFIMNAGLRLDYTNANFQWWNVDPFDINFLSAGYQTYEQDVGFPRIDPKPQWQLSPRLGISHPITENSKLFFNYGHFKQSPSYESLFRVGRWEDGRLNTMGNPNLTLAKTVSYELGYDHSLFNDYLVQLSAFYHDITDQQDVTTYHAISGYVYNRSTSNSYEDIRGFELTLRKSRGRWWTFFGNYTYQVSSSGHFGRAQIYQDPSKQKYYDEMTTNLYQNKPVPQPYARFNLSLFTPDTYGPSCLGLFPLGGYMANILLDWQSGGWETYNPKSISSVVNNVRRKDYFNSILRLSKTFRINRFRIQAFADINNLFNYRRMSMANFGGRSDDRVKYMESLHLPDNQAYDNIPGNDKVGEYRNPGVDYHPMQWRGLIDYENDLGTEGVIYYNGATREYMVFNAEAGAWFQADPDQLKWVLDNKAYIDMPNMSSFTFFNPRHIFFGARISFDLNK
ncbi:MAG TPA: TonB-dependent receptor [bacterium]|nr:TonB-dependent receptor [bacterium]